MKRNLRFVAAIGLIVIGIAACSKGSGGDGGGTNPPPPQPPPCSSVSAKFSTDVSVIVQNSCATAGCHGAGSNNGPGPLLTFEQIRNAAASIKSAVVSRSMPRGSTLTAAQIQSISCWVDGGALNN
jgi:hypothetical protein